CGRSAARERAGGRWSSRRGGRRTRRHIGRSFPGSIPQIQTSTPAFACDKGAGGRQRRRPPAPLSRPTGSPRGAPRGDGYRTGRRGVAMNPLAARTTASAKARSATGVPWLAVVPTPVVGSEELPLVAVGVTLLVLLPPPASVTTTSAVMLGWIVQW